MYVIDKAKFGAFVAKLRKEKEMTQKELAQQLFVSDKAVSKWETGASIPDTALLIPLAEILGVTVTELLLSERICKEEPLDAGSVDGIVRAAIAYAEELPEIGERERRRWSMIYLLCLLAGLGALFVHHLQGHIGDILPASLAIGAVFGAYFCFFAKAKLPAYYDEHKIGGILHGPFRMNIPGLSFNNGNWPHIVRFCRIWSCALMSLYPLLSAAALFAARDFWLMAEEKVFLILALGGLFLPVYGIGKKYE